jgi:hypothetical protein
MEKKRKYRNVFCALTCIRSYHGANPNRGRDQRAKTIIGNGNPHGFISSACRDYAYRMAMKSWGMFKRSDFAERTRFTADILMPDCIRLAGSPEKGRSLAYNILFSFSAKSERKEAGRTNQTIIQYPSLFEGIIKELERVKREGGEDWEFLLTLSDEAVLAAAFDEAGLNDDSKKKEKRAVEKYLDQWMARAGVHRQDAPKVAALVASMARTVAEGESLEIEAQEEAEDKPAPQKRKGNGTVTKKKKIDMTKYRARVIKTIFGQDRVPKKYLRIPLDVLLQGNMPIDGIYERVTGAMITAPGIGIDVYQPSEHICSITDTVSPQSNLVPIDVTRYTSLFHMYSCLDGVQMYKNGRGEYSIEDVLREYVNILIEVAPGAIQNHTGSNNTPVCVMAVISPFGCTNTADAFLTPPDKASNKFGQAAANMLFEYTQSLLPTWVPQGKPMVFAPAVEVPSDFVRFTDPYSFAEKVAEAYAEAVRPYLPESFD